MAIKRLRILLDGTEIAETPIGWKDITSSITRVKELKSIFITNDAKLTFTSDGYDYLIGLYENSFCSSSTAELQEYVNGYYQTFFTGIIYLKSATVDRANCTIEVSVEDNSFYAKIDNNKSIEVYPFGSLTKNGLDLAPCDFVQLVLFDPNDGSTITPAAPAYTGAAYTVYDLFAYLISFISDNTVGFDSNLFAPNGAYGGLTVTIGQVLRQFPNTDTGTTEQEFKDNFKKISFQKLFIEVDKKVNIGMYVDYSNPLPVIRIERAGDVRTEALIFEALNILGLKETIAEDDLYSSVRLGSGTTSDKAYTAPETGLLFPEAVAFLGPKEEQFLILGECNIDNELNLVSEWIISSNVIEDCLIHGEDQYDNELFFVMCDTNGITYTAQQANLEGTLMVYPVFYNLNLFGNAVMNNYYGAIPLSIAQYLGTRDNTFSARRDTDYILDDFNGAFTDELLPFPTDVIDGNNLWDGNYYSVTINGLYTFNVNFTIAAARTILTMEVYIDRLDPALALISSVLIDSEPFLQFNIKDIISSGSIVANAGDFIRIRVHYLLSTSNTPQAAVISHATISCVSTADGGGIYKTFDPNIYPAIRHHWEYPLTFSQFKNIAQNQTGKIEFSRFGERRFSGWIDSIKFKRFSDEIASFITYRAKNIPIIQGRPPEIQLVMVTGSLPDIPFTITSDYYGRPFGGSNTTVKTYFYLVGQTVNISIDPAYLGVPINPSVAIALTIFAPGNTSLQTTVATTFSFVIQQGTNYTIQLVYSLIETGETYPTVTPYSTAPATLGDDGVAGIILVSPVNPADYTFLWDTGATTQSIVAPPGNYRVTVTNTNPGTFDHNIIIYNIQIPVSVTGS